MPNEVAFTTSMIDREISPHAAGGRVSTRAKGPLPIVYIYPGCRWDMAPAARHRYLMQAMAEYTQVVFLNSPIVRGDLWEWHRPSLQSTDGRILLVHNALGMRSTRVGRHSAGVAAAIDAHCLHRLLRRAGIGDYTYWVSAPDPMLLTGMRYRHLVYDCIDPCFTEDASASFDRAEFLLASQASAVFCTAEALLERIRQINPSSCLLPNACEPEDHFPAAYRLGIPASLHGRPRPIIGYLGTIDWRIDVEILHEAAQRLPRFTFVIAGRVNRDQEPRVRCLRQLANVMMPGALSPEEGRAYTAAFDVALIPFLAGPMGDAINPVKMYMYLAAGKPVVSTCCRECVRHAPLVTAAANAEDFAAAIRNAAENDTPENISARIEFAQRNTWRDRARAAAQYLHQKGVL